MTITGAMLEVADLDDPAAALEYTLGSVPANGELRLSGTPLPVGGHFTQADIDTALVSYLHDGSETTGDAFTFTVSDGAGGSIGATTFTIAVAGVNDGPVAADGSDAMVEDGASFNSAADFNGTASFDYRVSDRGDPDNCVLPGRAVTPPRRRRRTPSRSPWGRSTMGRWRRTGRM